MRSCDPSVTNTNPIRTSTLDDHQLQYDCVTVVVCMSPLDWLDETLI